MNAYVTFYSEGRETMQAFTWPGSSEHCELVIDESVSWQMAAAARAHMEEALTRAMAAGDPYPEQEAYLMRNTLGWTQGLHHLQEAVQKGIRPALKLTLDYRTCYIIPELIPITMPDAGVLWLDTCGPIYRTLLHVVQPAARRFPAKSLAILYQNAPEFKDLAGRLRQALRGILKVDTYSGQELETGPTPRIALLSDIFHRHRSVLYLGNLASAPQEGTGGWQLTERCVLTMKELRDFFGVGKGQGQPGRPHTGTCVPEVVFANCCFSAGEDPETRSEPALSYAKLFLDTGVRFFIGTSMNVYPNQALRLRKVELMLADFFTGTAGDPDHAVEHFYSAKYGEKHKLRFGSRCDLIMALYQIYTSGGEQAIGAGGRAPTGALVSGIAPGDRLGPYVLGRELWADRYARTFWATNEPDGTNHLVQVLVDEWQNDQTIAADLHSAGQRFTNAALGPDHLIPSRPELVMMMRDGRAVRRLHVLVYDRPAGEQPASWSTLISRSFGRRTRDDFMQIVELGAQISRLLAQLHAAGIVHGNLDQGSIVFLQRDGVYLPVIKDAWVHHTHRGRCTRPHYAAPEELAEGGFGSELKHDCWGLGVILFELATGQAPFGEAETPEHAPGCSIRDVLGRVAGGRVPEALDRVVRECLVPSARLRPSAEFIMRRLNLAAATGGGYTSEFEESLNAFIQAGHRLFAIRTDDFEALELALDELAAQAYPRVLPGATASVEYHVFEAIEDIGLTDRRFSKTIVPWADAAAIRQIALQANPGARLPDGFPIPENVQAVNAAMIFDQLAQLSHLTNRLPVVLIRGNAWWDCGPVAWRFLKNCQANPDRSPVIILADSFLSPPPELSDRVELLDFPPPSPTELFEKILSFPERENGPCGISRIAPLTGDMAISLAHGFFPSTIRRVERNMRMCAMMHGGVVDRMALDFIEHDRAAFFDWLGSAQFTGPSHLPPPDTLGLPEEVESSVDKWVQAAKAAPDGAAAGLPRLVLIAGSSGCGKTSLAQHLCVRTNRALIRIDLGGCMRREMGTSELTLRATLEVAAQAESAILLIEDVDRFFGGAGSAASPTIARMSGVVLNWLDSLPPTTIVVMTATNPSLLSPQWRRRVQLRLTMPEPVADQPYRTAVFRAVFCRFGLRPLSDDHHLMQVLAARSDPVNGDPAFPSPYARRFPGSGLAGHRPNPKTCADIAGWVSEVLLAHDGDVNEPAAGAFWLSLLDKEISDAQAHAE